MRGSKVPSFPVFLGGGGQAYVATAPRALLRRLPCCCGSTFGEVDAVVGVPVAARCRNSRQVLRFLLWRLLGLVAALAALALIAWLLGGGPGRALRGLASPGTSLGPIAALPALLLGEARAIWGWAPVAGVGIARLLLELALALSATALVMRWTARRRRRYVRLRIDPYRTDRASADALVTMFEVLHKRLPRRWGRGAVPGQ